MNTFAWVLILIAALLVRQVYKGRVMNVGEDLSDAFIALASNDQKKLKEVLSRTGDSNSASVVDLGPVVGGVLDGVTGTAGAVAGAVDGSLNELERRGNNSVALASMILGSKAKGYRWGANGPTYYDCSGLMWAAMKLTKAYTGARFNTATFPALTKGTYTKVSGAPQVEDIVLWPLRVPYATGHMGVCVAPDTFYSARSVRTGIGDSKISTFRNYQPTVYRRTRFPSPDGGK